MENESKKWIFKVLFIVFIEVVVCVTSIFVHDRIEIENLLFRTDDAIGNKNTARFHNFFLKILLIFFLVFLNKFRLEKCFVNLDNIDTLYHVACGQIDSKASNGVVNVES